MVTIDANAIWVILVAVGVPSGIVGFLIRKLEKKMDATEKAREEKEEERVQLQKTMIDLAVDSLELAKVTAEAVQRIPDANCNGEMHAALQQADSRLRGFRENERKMAAKAMV